MERAASVADLVRLRMDGDVAGLCRATRSEDHHIAVYATELLGSSTGPPEAVDALFASLRRRGEPYPGLPWQAAKALGRLRVRRAVPELLDLLAEGPHGREQLDRPACDALVAIGGPEVVQGLIGLLGRFRAEGYLAFRVLDALARLRPPEAVEPLLVALWDNLPQRADHVVRTLGAIGDPRAGNALLALAHSPASDTSLRRAAVTALHALPEADWPPPRTYPSAETLLHEPQRAPDAETARLATALLSRTEEGRGHLWEVLRAAARSPHHPDCPPHAVIAVCDRVAEEPDLFDVPDPDAYDALLRHHLREAAVPAVRRAAARALAAYAGAEAADVLLAALGDAHLSDAVADLVADFPGPPRKQLMDLLTDPDGTVAGRRGAARALGGIGHAGAGPALEAVLADDAAPVSVRTAAADALGALGHARSAAPLAALAEDAAQPGTLRARAVGALGLIGAPETLPVVLACTGSPHEAVRARAVAALGGFPVAEAAEALGDLVTNSTESDVARAAMRALARIGAPALPVLVALADAVDGLVEDLSDQLVAALAARPEAESTAALERLAAAPEQESTRTPPGAGRLAASRPAREAASLALVERGTAECLAPLVALLGPDTWFGAHEAAVRALLRIGTGEAHELVLTHCRDAPHKYSWHVEALDAVARARGITLGP
ncbi:HEAT repeat domain-containing protein [Streptomyces sp. NPDC059063]|uniref:HEAT repeat domain-containing protein n=1 Tax=unclassified Streptomyces TaxID=2593676 RepID=UPI0036B8AB9F